MPRQWLIGAVAVFAVAACGLDVMGRAEPDTATPDAGRSIPKEAPPKPPADAGPGADGAVGCPPAATFTNGELTARPAATAVTIDGDLSEWQCAQFFTFDATTAAMVIGVKDIPNRYSFAVAWDASYVYVAARVMDPPPLEGNATGDEIYSNDAIEVYLSESARPDGTYGPNDHQWVVDWANRTQVYQGTSGAEPSAGFTSMVKPNATGYEVEVRIAASELGYEKLTADTSVRFAIAGVNSKDATQSTWMVWHRAAGPDCTDSVCCNAHCDTRFMGGLVFGP
jgi:hypothetical protein